ncbi:helicase [Methylobacterium oryzisoli]|uniref:helicase n=1 Tax=Methylobacterium oryzisoli TaxID=3385502 RepID=UPI0038923722
MSADLIAYRDFIAAKRIAFEPAGLDVIPSLNESMFPHQRHGVEFALRLGRAALFYDTGLGKSLAALEWGRVVVAHTGKPVLLLAPLAVGQQHKREADRFGIDAEVVRSQDEIGARRIYITNYDRLDRFDPSKFGGVILDESSVLKSFTGKTTRRLIEAFAVTPFRLCCTATPAPNDHTEIGTHAEFLGVMRREEMLPIWFINDTADTGTWRVKGHARENFWSWVATWARCVSRPSDLGFDDGGFALPELTIKHHEVKADRSRNAGAEKDGQARLFRIPNTSATSIHEEKRLTVADRAALVAEIVGAEPDEPWLIWVDTDYEADAVRAAVPEASEVRGSQSSEDKERRLVAFSEGRARILLTKPSVAGFGLNFQHCARQCFAGLSFSYEAWYQAVRRSWRFGQSRPVHVHVVCADTERAIWTVVERKAGDHEAMKREMVAAMRRAMREERARKLYHPEQEVRLPAWVA